MDSNNQNIPLKFYGFVLIIICLAGSFVDVLAYELEEQVATVNTDAQVDQNNLSDNWFAWRNRMIDTGIEFNVANTSDILVNRGGGINETETLSNLLEVSTLIDMQRLVGLQGGSAYIMVLGTHGRDIGIDTGTIHAPSNLAAEDSFRIFEMWYEHSFFDDQLGVLLGQYAVDSEFDAKTTADVFVNGGFGTGLDLSETGLNGPSIFPATAFGTRIRANLTDSLEFKLAVLDGVPGDPDDPTDNGIRFRDGDGLFLIGEMNYIVPKIDYLRIGLGAWHYTADFDELLDVDINGNPDSQDGTYGAYGFAEGVIFNEAGRPDQGLSGFVRFGFADEDVNQIASYIGGGLVYTGLFPGRDEDVLGLGVSVGFNGDDFRDAARLEGNSVNKSEKLIELTYNAAVFPWLNLQPVFQYYMNPGTDRALDDNYVFGLRLGVGL